MIWLRDTFNLNIQRLRKNTYILAIFAIRAHVRAPPLIEYCTISHFDTKTKIYFWHFIIIFDIDAKRLAVGLSFHFTILMSEPMSFQIKHNTIYISYSA